MRRPTHNGNRRNRRDSQGGYVLLTLLVGAAVVLVTLARQLPRDAMSAQRIREQKLIKRGEQYSRAIQLYFREHKKYPKTLRDLERTDGRTYLRGGHDDPMTDSGEWRIIKMGPEGRFKDSLLYDTEDEDGFGGRRRRNRAPDSANYVPMGEFRGGDRARMLRESDAPDNPLENQGTYGAAFTGSEAQQYDADGNPIPPDQQQQQDYSQVRPGEVPENAGQTQQQQAGIPGLPGQPGSFPNRPNQPGANSGNSRMRPSRGSIGSRGRGGFAGFGANSAAQRAAQQAGMQQQQAVPPGGAGFGAAGNQASQLISRLLTTPRPGGLAGLRRGGAQQQAQQAQNGPMFEEGIAGVASRADEVGVKVYQGQENYKLWEFVYDYRQDQGGMGGGAPGGGASGAGLAPGQPGVSGAQGLSGFPQGAVQPGEQQQQQQQQSPGMAPPEQTTRTPYRDGRQTTSGGPGTPNLPSTTPSSPYPTRFPGGQPGATPGYPTPNYPTATPQQPGATPQQPQQPPFPQQQAGQPQPNGPGRTLRPSRTIGRPNNQ